MGYDDYSDDQSYYDYSSPSSYGSDDSQDDPGYSSPYGPAKKRVNLLDSPLYSPDVPGGGDYNFDPNWDALLGSEGKAQSDISNGKVGPARWKELADQFGIGKAGTHATAYQDFLQSQPKQEDYAPGKGRRIAALLGGVGQVMSGGDERSALDAQSRINDQPYNDALSSYKIRGDRLKQAADVEQKDINNRTKAFWDSIRYEEEAAKEARQGLNTNSLIGRRNALNTRPTYAKPFTDSTGKVQFIQSLPGQAATVQDTGVVGETTKDKQNARAAAQKEIDKQKDADRMAYGLAMLRGQGANQASLQKAKHSDAVDLLKEGVKLKKSYVFHLDEDSGILVGINKADPDDRIWTDVTKATESEKARLRTATGVAIKGAPSGSTDTTVVTTTTPAGKTSTKTTTPKPAAKPPVAPIPTPAPTGPTYFDEKNNPLDVSAAPSNKHELWINSKGEPRWLSPEDVVKAQAMPGWKKARTQRGK